MKIILKQTIESLGDAGEIISVSSGYGRNYLIPKGLGIIATKRTIKATKKLIEQQEIKQANTKKGLELISDKLNSIKLKFTLKAGEDEKLFGSVTTQMISNELIAKGYKVDKKHISLDESIKSLGNHFAMINFGDDITAKVKIKVEKE